MDAIRTKMQTMQTIGLIVKLIHEKHLVTNANKLLKKMNKATHYTVNYLHTNTLIL